MFNNCYALRPIGMGFSVCPQRHFLPDGFAGRRCLRPVTTHVSQILQYRIERRQYDQDQYRGGQETEHDSDHQGLERLCLGRGLQQQRRHSHYRGRDRHEDGAEPSANCFTGSVSS